MQKKFLINIMVLFLFIFFIPISVKAYDNNCWHFQQFGYHDWSSDYHSNPKDLNDTYHQETYICMFCDATKYQSIKHDWMDVQYSLGIKSLNENQHGYPYKCSGCGKIKYVASAHDFNSFKSGSPKNLNSSQHQTPYKCYQCGYVKYTAESHDWSPKDSYKKYNASSHNALYECLDCHAQKYVLEEHEFIYTAPLTWATPKNKGISQYNCKDCNQICKKSFVWSYKKASNKVEGYENFDISYHNVLKNNSKTLTIKTYSCGTGYTIKAKIGKKSYTRKINGKTNKYKIKIKKPKIGEKVSIKVYYKGKCVGKDYCDESDDDHVWYSGKMKKGLTKTQVRWKWGAPRRTSSSSGGWTFWHWGDGSYVGFKKGKVRYWYNAAG